MPAARIYVDHGLTGTTRERPGLKQALAACREDDTLVVTKLDRLARSSPDARAISDMMLRRSQAPRAGGFLAGPQSTMHFVRDKRPSTEGWTVDRSGRAQRGDLVRLYGSGPLQSCVAIARVCSPSVQNYKAKGRRRKNNREWWSYLQIQPLVQPVARATIEALPAAQRPGSGLQQPRGSPANRVAPEAAEAALELLTQDDAKAASRLHAWRTGTARWPRHLDLDNLRHADWHAPETRSPEEIVLCQRIARRLVAKSGYRYLTRDDVVGKAPTSWNPRAVPDRMSLEHRITDQSGTGRIDILLVDTRVHEPTLLAIEVKLRATPAGSRNPIPQIFRYRDALQQRSGADWNVRVLLVAAHFSDLTVEEAQATTCR